MKFALPDLKKYFDLLISNHRTLYTPRNRFLMKNLSLILPVYNNSMRVRELSDGLYSKYHGRMIQRLIHRNVATIELKDVIAHIIDYYSAKKGSAKEKNDLKNCESLCEKLGIDFDSINDIVGKEAKLKVIPILKEILSELDKFAIDKDKFSLEVQNIVSMLENIPGYGETSRSLVENLREIATQYGNIDKNKKEYQCSLLALMSLIVSARKKLTQILAKPLPAKPQLFYLDITLSRLFDSISSSYWLNTGQKPNAEKQIEFISWLLSNLAIEYPEIANKM